MSAIAPWDAWRPATCMPEACFCETVHSTLIRQPMNTWSSLAFVLVAGAIVWHGRSAPHTHGRGVVHRLYIVALIWIGIGSAFYHASLTYWGQFADVSGMYLLATVALLARAQHHLQLRARTRSSSFSVAVPAPRNADHRAARRNAGRCGSLLDSASRAAANWGQMSERTFAIAVEQCDVRRVQLRVRVVPA